MQWRRWGWIQATQEVRRAWRRTNGSGIYTILVFCLLRRATANELGPTCWCWNGSIQKWQEGCIPHIDIHIVWKLKKGIVPAIQWLQGHFPQMTQPLRQTSRCCRLIKSTHSPRNERQSCCRPIPIKDHKKNPDSSPMLPPLPWQAAPRDLRWRLPSCQQQSSVRRHKTRRIWQIHRCNY